MSIKIEAELSGFDEFDNLLKKLPERVEKRVLQKSVNKALRSSQKAFKAAAPRHTGEQSPASKEYGTGRKNIKVKKLRRVRKGQKAARLDTGNAFWLYIYEKGSRYQPARPWFLQAFQKSREAILNVLRDELGKNIESEAKKLAGHKK